MTKQEFIFTFAHFMSEHDLNEAYNSHFEELGYMGSDDIEEWLENVLAEDNKRVTNAEKYAEQIAELIASRVDGVCAIFSKLELLRCGICPLHGVCNDKDKLKAWLLQESEEF